MSIDFDGSTDYYTASSSVVGSDKSFTFGGWFYPNNTTANKYNWHLHTNAGTSDSAILTATNNGVLRFVVNAGTSQVADTANGAYSANTWQLALAIHNSITDREVQVGSGTPGTSTTSSNFNPLTHTSIGRHDTSTSTYFNGELAHLFIYDVGLTTAERTMLANRVSPLLVRPENLLFYAPLVNGTSIDNQIESGPVFTENGTPAEGVTHPPIHWGRRSWHVSAPVVVGGGLGIPIAAYHYNHNTGSNL